MSFAHTKIQQPRPRSSLLLSRPTLERELVQALCTQRVVLLCAPAGYGKTALLASALQQLPERHAVAWISLDPGDDLHRLLECLMAALEPFDLPWRTAPEGLMAAVERAGDQPPTQVTDELVNTLQACDVAHGVIVLDDLHHVDDPACLSFLALLLQRLGTRWTVAITARHEPALRLARLRALGELADIGQAQLQFSRDEVAELMAAAGHDAAQAERLHERTGGWPAGLRLALGGARGSNLRSAIDRQAFEFLATEVLAQIDPALREFLLLTSVLPDLDAARCAAVSGDADAARKLDQIERLGLFASVVDDAVHTLKLHDLFRDALQHRLRVERPDDWVALHQRAAAVETDPVRKQQLLLAAGRLEEAARALVDAGIGLLTQGAVSTIVRLYEQYPPAFAQASAELQMLVGEAKWALWDTGPAERHLARAEQLFRERGDAALAQRASGRRAVTLVALGRLQEAGVLIESLRQQPLEPDARRLALLATTWHVMEAAHYDSVAAPFMELVQCLEEAPALDRWNNTIPAPRQTSCRGIAPALARWASGAMAAAGDRPVPLHSLATMTRAWIALWQGRLDEAEDLLARADADAQWIGQQNISRNQSLAMHALLDVARGRHAEAVQAVRQRVAEHPPTYGDWGLWHSLSFAARVAAACGDLASAGDWTRRLTALQPGLPDATPERLRPAQALQGTIAWLEGRAAEAIALWREALRHEAHMDLLGQANEVRVRLAHALLQTQPLARALPEAAALLEPMLARVVDGPNGALYVGASLAALAAVDWQGHLSREQVSTLQGWTRLLAPQQAPTATEAAASSPGAPQQDLLSAREWEVLGYIANGQSNKLIARAMDLSPFTVKRHVANILDKLALASRGQAAAWYHAQAELQR
ncbi:MAG: LuxR C-terminal-related transcriptional regulator [Pseudomonadota bacterium]